MIPIRRGNEPGTLRRVRERELPELQKRAPAILGAAITGYEIAKDTLWSRQHHKCCYCELRVRLANQDVEHYRPKGLADRSPGSVETHGYWWLAFTWENLLFACKDCNERKKRVRFPLSRGDTALQPREDPPGRENPLLLDPAGPENPVQHIEFEYRCTLPGERVWRRDPKHWFAKPRNGSERGRWTIDVCGLNDADLIELRDDHVEMIVRARADDLCGALERAYAGTARREHARALGLFKPPCYFAALSYDALRLFVPEATLAQVGLRWPSPAEVGLPAPPRPLRRRRS